MERRSLSAAKSNFWNLGALSSGLSPRQLPQFFLEEKMMEEGKETTLYEGIPFIAHTLDPSHLLDI